VPRPSPLTDDDGSAHGDPGQHVAHRVDGRPVAALLVAATGPPACRERGGLGDPHQVQAELVIR